ncbi:MAG: hypothetical protein H0V01_01565 [Bacteroidetes bacterium]|nr:hypothetical protein [Bacteroidota bacterium]HET6243229.1 hypothetical protein [Bacteroidia bacterium]
MHLRIIILIVLSFVFSPGFAQLFDTIAVSFKYKPRIEFKLDSRNSFITTQRAKIFGVKIGYEYNETVKLGIGYNQLVSTISKEKVIVDEFQNNQKIYANLKFVFVSPYFEYVFHRNKKWEHTIPLQLGFGNTWYEYKVNGRNIRENYRPIILYEPAMTTQYKIMPWFGIGVGLGYRILLLNNNSINENFNSPIYVLKMKVFLGTIVKSIWPKNDQKRK